MPKTWLKPALIAVALVVAGALLWLIVKNLMGDSGKSRKQIVQRIELVQMPPPPPPPPPPEKPPEVKEEIKMDEPEAKPEEPPEAPPANLGLDADASGSDAFGLAARKGGRDITGFGGDGGPFAFYTRMIKDHFDEELRRNKKLRSREYRVVVRVWIARDGRIERFEVAGSSGNGETDAVIRQVLAGMPPLREAPPGDMPQPVKLRITARGAS